MMGSRARWLVVVGLGICACSDPPATGETVATAAADTVDDSVVAPGGIVLPPKIPPITNPLDLPEPSDQPVPTEGQRVFAVPQAMLESAQLGSAMKLKAAKVLRREGENYEVQIGFGAPYPIHPAYMVIPRAGRMRRGTFVIASYGGELRHAVVKHRIRDRVAVRFTDLGVKRPDQKLDPSRVGILSSGLAPGGYAAYTSQHAFRHVLLVSSAVLAGKRRWLVLGYTGESELVSEDKLTPLPVKRFKPKVGAPVLAAWRGSMVRAQVTAVDRPALLTVTRAHAGRPLVVGPGMVMPAD